MWHLGTPFSGGPSSAELIGLDGLWMFFPTLTISAVNYSVIY